MEVITDKNLKKLEDLGFEKTYMSENGDFMRLVHKEYHFRITLYKTDPRDDYQGIQMSIDDIDGKQIKQYKARNVVSNARRWLERIKKTGQW